MFTVRSSILKTLISSNFSKFKYFSTLNNEIKVCIVGGGAAGFYSSQYLLKHLPNTQIDVIEKLPVPFGLVRYGVAPDHPEVKNVINTFNKTAQHPNFKYYGNVSLGKEVTLDELRKAYNIVVLSYGSEIDTLLNISGEDKKNFMSAREFVGWYNGTPGLEELNPDLSGEEVILIGNGNVAIDVARILLTPVDILKKTDITEYSIEALSRSKVKKVYMVGRRGPLQAAFTIAELREMLKIPNVQTIWRSADFEGITSDTVTSLPRPKKRITELMLKSLQEAPKASSDDRQFLPIFFRSPIRINGDSQVESIDFSHTVLNNDRAIATNDVENITGQLVCRSIGYKATNVDPSINFDDKNGRVVNKHGRVLMKDSTEIDKGLYVAGWLGTGPSGVILTTMNNAFQISQTIIDDIKNGELNCDEKKPGFDYCKFRAVTWDDWKKIDEKEVECGKKLDKPREKIVSVDEMLKLI
ncbi:hypothetical protein ACKWTF_004284 [Chironomus riparius]